MNLALDNPYASVGRELLTSGLGGPLPLPVGAKYPPPRGWTGHGAPYPSAADVEAWVESQGTGNVALRLAGNVVGIDVDAHSGKPGAATLAEFSAQHGKLPRTWRSTSRDDNRSGIYFYRVPDGTDTAELVDMGPGVETIRAEHRYALAAPSVHPFGSTYRWIAPDGQASERPPSIDDLPELTPGHVAALRRPTSPATASAPTAQPVNQAADPEGVARWLAAVDRGDAELLTKAATWPEGHCDEYGRGWQKVVADLAYRRAGIARGGWSGRDELAALRAIVPEVVAKAVDVAATWAAQWQRGPIVAEPAARPDVLFDGLTVDTTTGEVLDEPRARVLPADGTFWEERDSLRHIRDFARARRTSPDAVLGVVLARVAATVPPTVRLPPIVGGEGSLNLFVALVAPSGGGKGAAEAAARDAVHLAAPIDTVQTGSGEGLAHVFGRRVKGHVERHRYAAVVSIPEVDTLAAIGSRQGSTLLPTMRAAWSGEGLGNQNADTTRTVPIAGHTYRLSAIVGVQPEKSAALLDDADGGTPQRFVWLPATDPGAPDIAPAEPAPLVLSDQRWPASVLRLVVPKVAEREIVDARLARMRGDGEALDAHLLLCQLKVAAALTVLDDRRTITADDWSLAGRVMAKSLETRAACVATLQRAAAEANHRRGRQDGLRQLATTEVITDDASKRVAKGILAKLRHDGEWTRSNLRKSVNSRDRGFFDEALERLVKAGQVAVTETAHGERISTTEVTP